MLYPLHQIYSIHVRFLKKKIMKIITLMKYHKNYLNLFDNSNIQSNFHHMANLRLFLRYKFSPLAPYCLRFFQIAWLTVLVIIISYLLVKKYKLAETTNPKCPHTTTIPTGIFWLCRNFSISAHRFLCKNHSENTAASVQTAHRIAQCRKIEKIVGNKKCTKE